MPRSNEAAQFAPAPDAAVDQTRGRYKHLKRVGEGGWGVVYVAEQTEPVRRLMALSIIKPGKITNTVSRWRSA
jgi:serine/threonine-protein kinase